MSKINKEKTRILFGDIIKGFSVAHHREDIIYLKHLNILDNIDLEQKKHLYFLEAKTKGLPTKDEKEDFLCNEGLWSKEQNIEIEKIKKLISGLESSKSKVFKENDINFFKKEIEKETLNLNKILFKKNELMGYTAEDYSAKKINEYFIFVSLYKDVNFKNRLFSKEDYDNLSQEDLDELMKIYNIKINDFSSLSLKRISLSHYYLNLFNICNENIYNLYGKPVVNLTYYQIETYNHARYFRNQLSEAKHKPPKDTYEDPDLLIEWLDSAKNAEEIMNKSMSKNKKNPDFVATSIVGASKKDIEKISKDEEGISLQDIAKKQGGVLSMEDMIKLHKV